MIMSAAVFYRAGVRVASIQEAHHTLEPILGAVSGLAFSVALLASGISSSVTGTFAGQIVMEGFLKFRMKAWIRRLLTRLITMIPALIAVGAGVEPLKILVASQVILSFQLPFAVIPLIMFTKRKSIMGEYANRPMTNVAAVTAAAIVIGLNLVLVFKLLGGRF